MFLLFVFKIYPCFFFLSFNSFLSFSNLISPWSSAGLNESTESPKIPSSSGRATTMAMAIKHTNKAWEECKFSIQFMILI